MTVFPLMGIWLYFNFGQEWLLAVPQLENDHFYRWLTWATVPMHFLVLIVIAVFVGTQDLSMISVVVMAITAGSYSGLGLQGTLVFMFGWVMVPFLLHNFWAWLQLTSANYIEHYGLLRQRDENGRYERCEPHHSWNASYVFSNFALYHLERHSDHHANPMRRYQSLRNFEDIPQLPTGYNGMYLLA